MTGSTAPCRPSLTRMTDESAFPSPTRRAGRRRPRRWREGGSTTARWDLEMLGWAVLALGAGALVSRAASEMLPVETRAASAQAVIWLAFAVPVVFALGRSRPRGLLVFRTVDLLYGVVFGILVRLAQGAIAGAGGEPAPWPTTFSADGALPTSFLFDAVAGTIVSSAVEEFFFRGVVLVGVYTVLRRLSGPVAAGVAAAVLSTGSFVGAHLLVAAPGSVDAPTLGILGLVASALVLGSGRLGGALFTHIVFNATGYALIAVGTLSA